MMEMRYSSDAENFRFPVMGGNGKSDVSLLSGFVASQKETWRPSVFSSPHREDELMDERKSDVSPVPSWHPHVYSSPPKLLTPHCIVDIIGRDREEPLNLTLREEETKKRKKGQEEDRGRKKMRTTFTGRQIFELEKMFEVKKYLNSSERSDMSRLLNVTEQQVKIWFQNRRTKWKKQENVTNEEAAQLLKNKGGNGDANVNGENKEETQKKSSFNKSIQKSNQDNLDKSLQQNSPVSFMPSIQTSQFETTCKTLNPAHAFVASLQPNLFNPNPDQFDQKCLSMPILDSVSSARTGNLDPESEVVKSGMKEMVESDGDLDDEDLLSVGGDDKDSSSILETSELVIDEGGDMN